MLVLTVEVGKLEDVEPVHCVHLVLPHE